MSNKLKKKAEKISQLLERLASASDKGVPIIVEGQKDIDALRKLDIKGSITTAKTYGKSLVGVVDEVRRGNFTEIILLMDFDRRGKEWVKRLTERLEKTNTKPNLYFWRQLLSLVGRDVKDIESLASYRQTLQEKLDQP